MTGTTGGATRLARSTPPRAPFRACPKGTALATLTGVIEVRFGEADFRRVTFADAPDAMLETALSVRHLRGAGSGPPARRAELAAWRREVRPGLPLRAGSLAHLVRTRGYLPDFLYQPHAPDFAAAADLAGSTPGDQLAAGLAHLRLSDPAGAVPTGLTEGTPTARRHLVADLRRYHDTTVAPLWRGVLSAATTDRALRAQTLLRGGVDALLATLAPEWHWDPPTLRIPSHRSFRLELCGRGLRLLPSYFAESAMVIHDPAAGGEQYSGVSNPSKGRHAL